MPRPKGSRNQDHAARRATLIAALRGRLRARGPAPSLRELAAAAEVSVPTLRHHFGDRDGAVEAVLADDLAAGSGEGGPLAVAAAPSGPFAASVRDLLRHADAGFREGGLTEAHAAGLAEALRSERLGPRYLALALDPTLEAFAARLAEHQRRGEMRADADPRAAALALLAPLVLARLHQDRLGGAPLDVEAMLEQQAAAFAHGHAAES